MLLAGVFASTSMVNQPLDDTKEGKQEGKERGKKGKPKPENAMHIIKDDKPTDLPVYIRGDVNNKGPVVKRRFLQILDADKTPFETGSGRLELANDIANPQNPLTARVIVNRVWGQYFDQPLVAHAQQLRHPRRRAHASEAAR